MSSHHGIFRRIVVGIVLATVFCSLPACKKKEEAPAPAASAPAPQEAAAPAPEAAAPETKRERLAEKGESAPAAKRKIIVNQNMGLEVKSVALSLEALQRLAERNGGYVFNSARTGEENGAATAHAGLRVPAGRVSGVMAGIRGLGRVESESSTAEDITEEYVDTEARLANARASEARLKELYGRAGKLADVLEVEEELTRVRGDIEAFQAKKKNWDLLTSMVTIEVSLHEASAGFPTFHRFWGTIWDAFGRSSLVIAQSLHFLIVFVAGILPWLAVFGPIGYLVVKRRRKKRVMEAAKAGKARTSHDESEVNLTQ